MGTYIMEAIVAQGGSPRTPIVMAHSPFESNTQIKCKIEPADGLSFWFAEIPEGGVTENTYLSACVSSSFTLGLSEGFACRLFWLPILTPASSFS